MPNEIERKFIVRSMPDALDQAPSESLKQGYLGISNDGEEARIRRADEVCTLTVKQGSGLVRREVEIPISLPLFETLWPATKERRVKKTRFRLPHNDLTIEIDQYADDLSGLIIAEIEFPTESSALAWDPPPWLGREVTHDAAYKNQQLAKQGRPIE